MIYFYQRLPIFIVIFFLTGANAVQAADLQSVCNNSGEQGYGEFQQKLTPQVHAKFRQWEAEVLSRRLLAPSSANEFYSICTLESSCGAVANWFVSMSPSVKLRREAVFMALNGLSLRGHSPRSLRDWNDVRSYLTSVTNSAQPPGTKAQNQIELLRKVIRKNSSRGSSAQILKWICRYTSSDNECAATANAIAEEVSPGFLNAREWPALGANAMALTLSVPDVMASILLDVRYVHTLALVNVAMLAEVERLERATLSDSLTSVEVPALESMLESAIRTVFKGDAEESLSRKLDILAFYGSRGSSFLGLINYLPAESSAFLVHYGVFANLINYIDALQEQTANTKEGYFSIPGRGNGGCLQSKPYHQIFSRALAEIMLRRGYSRRSVAAAALSMAFAYRIASQGPTQVPDDMISKRESMYFQIRRLDLVMSAIGILKGIGSHFQLDPQLALAGMERSVGSDSATKSVEAFKPIEFTSPRGIFSPLIFFYQEVQVARGLGIQALVEVLENAAAH